MSASYRVRHGLPCCASCDPLGTQGIGNVTLGPDGVFRCRSCSMVRELAVRRLAAAQRVLAVTRLVNAARSDDGRLLTVDEVERHLPLGDCWCEVHAIARALGEPDGRDPADVAAVAADFGAQS